MYISSLHDGHTIRCNAAGPMYFLRTNSFLLGLIRTSLTVRHEIENGLRAIATANTFFPGSPSFPKDVKTDRVKMLDACLYNLANQMPLFIALQSYG